jgi:hypothetical protein
MITLGFVLLLQTGGGAWSATPARPTVGDTIWLERTVTVAPGWRVRAGKFEPGQQMESLGDAAVLASSGGWVVRYPVVAWSPGKMTVDMPPLWHLGADGTADSVSGGNAVIDIASVIPDSVRSPGPQPALGPLRLVRTSPIPLLAALLLAVGSLVALVAWRRRAPRRVGAAPPFALDPTVADSRWLAAGEPKAVAARAAYRLRSAIAHAIPDAHEALSTSECLAAVERARPDAPLRELRDLLGLLDQVAFATAHAVDVAPLCARAQALARRLAENGKQ